MELLETARNATLRLLKMHYESGVGHIGGNLSCLHALLVLYHKVLKPQDLFILSKGHAAGALYIALWSTNRLSDDALISFHRNDTDLAGHPMGGNLPGVRFSTGSLGHGFSLACGVALARRTLGRTGRVVCLLSDGEWQEGSTWEALQWSAHNQLGNLTVLVDCNGLQGLGSTKEIMSMISLGPLLKGFNVEVIEIDGHDLKQIERATAVEGEKTRIIIMRTVKGYGVSFMQNRFEWHYKPLTKELYEQAIEEVQARES